MKFAIVEPEFPFDLWVMRSETGRFELVLRRVIFGIRASLCFEHKSYEVDYCIGTNGTIALLVLRSMEAILYNIPESESLIIIKSRFPLQYNRPMHNDPDCFAQIAQACSNAGVPEGALPPLPENTEALIVERFNLCSQKIAAYFPD